MADDLEQTATWIEMVRQRNTVPELIALFNELGGADNGPEFAQVFAWRRDELEQHHRLMDENGHARVVGVGTPYTSLAAAIEAVFEDWERVNATMAEHAKLWADADARVKKLQGKKYLYYKTQHGGSTATVEAYVNDDQEIFDARLKRNENEALLKVDYGIRDLVAAKWDYLRSLMTTEREGSAGRGPESMRHA